MHSKISKNTSQYFRKNEGSLPCENDVCRSDFSDSDLMADGIVKTPNAGLEIQCMAVRNVDFEKPPLIDRYLIHAA